MHAQQTKERFIELRGRGWSLARIADQVGISTRTAIEWQKQFRAEIDDLQAAHREALQERILNRPEEELTRLVSLLNSVEGVLAQKDLQNLGPGELCKLAMSLRKEIRQLQQPAIFTDDSARPPAAITATAAPISAQPI